MRSALASTLRAGDDPGRSQSSAPATSACRSRTTFADGGQPRPARRRRRGPSSTRSTAARATSRTSRRERLAPLVERRARSARRPTTTTLRDADAILIALPTPLSQAARARPLDRRDAPPAAIAAVLRRGPGRRARVDDLPGHDARAAAADPRGGKRPEGGRGLPPRVVARARRPGPRGLDDEDDAEGRRRDHARVHRAAPPTSTAARSTPSTTVSTPEAAELTKLLENIFRSVNIALVNELAQLCDRMDIDVWEVVDAAATKPFGFMRFKPGPGPRRPLHPDRPVLPLVEGARVRLLHRVHRARRQGQRERCRTSAAR